MRVGGVGVWLIGTDHILSVGGCGLGPALFEAWNGCGLECDF